MLMESPSIHSVLLAGVDQSEINALAALMQTRGYNVTVGKSIEAALNLLKNSSFEILICEMPPSDQESLALIDEIKECAPEINIIFISDVVSADLAVTAIHKGAFDFLHKPVIGGDQLDLTLARLEEHLRVLEENKKLKQEVGSSSGFEGIIAQSEEMKRVFETVKRLSTFNSTVMISGESGTGKELIARAIHNNSLRKGRPFVAVNCGAIPETLIESELFGHSKGAFTDAVRDKRGLLEEASSGTLFLDEIGEMPPLLQVKLLRALQEKAIRPVGAEKTIEIDTRIIAATNRDLEVDIKAGNFREDLYYRLNVVAIHLPALRKRRQDIPFLCRHFIDKLGRKLSLEPKQLSAAALAKLGDYSWPGNIRELENCLERALLLAQGKFIEISDLPEQLRSFEPQVQTLSVFSNDSLSIKLHNEQLEIRLIKEALMRTGGNRTHAARLLEISHRALLYKLKDYQLSEFLKE